MKKFLVLSIAALISVSAGPAFASERPLVLTTQDLIAMSAVSPLDLINWKVGDEQDFVVSLGGFGNGSMVKSVTKDDGDGTLWLHEDMDLVIQKQSVDTQISKADGKVLKMIVNGQEQQIPDDKITIVSQDYTDITVPAGTFKAIHVVAKSDQAPKIEVWVNPRDTVMEGTLRQVMSTSMGIDIDMQLKSFKHGS